MLKTSSKTKSSKNLLLLINMAKNDKVGFGSNNDCKDETVKKSPFTFKNLDGATNYLTTNAKIALTQLKQGFIKVLTL